MDPTIMYPIESSTKLIYKHWNVSPGVDCDNDDVAVAQAGGANPWRPDCQEAEGEGWRIASGQRCIRTARLEGLGESRGWEGSRWFTPSMVDDNEDGDNEGGGGDDEGHNGGDDDDEGIANADCGGGEDDEDGDDAGVEVRHHDDGGEHDVKGREPEAS